MAHSVSSASSRPSTRARVASLGAAFLLLLPLLAQSASASSVIRTYNIRYQTTDHGSIALIGNTLVTCPDSDAACPGARDGTATGGPANNNNYVMQYVDVDADGATADSSKATLALPAGASIEFVGLYWQANSIAAARNQVQFAVPGSGYTTVTASTLDATGNVYGAFADVTAEVDALSDPNGTYTVGGVAADVGVTDRHAGWSLVVVYHDDAQPLRNLTVFDGFAIINSTAPTSITTAVSGFVTPATGTVNAEIGLVAGEGDLGMTGDRLQINGVNVTDATNPADNVFNSTISNLGTRVTAKNPDYVNQLGWDVDLIDATGLVANGATSANLTFTTGGETYYPQALTFAVDVFEPHIDVTKQGTDVNGGSLRPNDPIQYTIDITNDGSDPATAVVLTDPLPAHTTYVPGTLEILTGPNAGALSDTAGNDQGEVVAGTVTVRLGTGANGTTGGTLAIGASTSIRFSATIDNGTTAGTSIINQATVHYSGATLGAAFSDVSDSDAGTAGDQPDDLPVVPPSPPAPVDDTATAPQDGSVAIDVLANDTDPDGDIDPTTVTVTAGPAHGSVAIDPTTGVITYTPNAGYSGPDAFTYRVCDATALCATADVAVTVTPTPASPPAPVDDTATAPQDGSVVIDVLANDTDPDGDIDPTTVTVTAGPTHGSVTIDPTTGAVTYTPDPGYSGPDAFTYQVCDATALCATADVAVTVTATPASPPDPVDDTATVAEDGSVVIDVLANDTDPDGDIDATTVTVTAGPSHGSVTIDPTTGAVTYTPDPNYHGPDAFTYRVCDATALCATATVAVTVTSVPDPPVAVNDGATVAENGSVTIDVLGNDTDPDGDIDPTTVTVTTGPIHGTVTINPTTGAITYTPAADYHGPDAFTYQVCDATALCTTATVTLAVTAVPDTDTTPASVIAPPPSSPDMTGPLVGFLAIVGLIGAFAVLRRRSVT